MQAIFQQSQLFQTMATSNNFIALPTLFSLLFNGTSGNRYTLRRNDSFETRRKGEWFDFPFQEALVKRLGPNAHAFSMEITPLAPPSVQLVPAKEYNGAPIGTSYDVRAYVGE